MKKIFVKTLLCALLLINCSISKGQTGIFHFIPADTLMPNSKVLAINQTNEGGLIMLVLRSDSKYMNHTIEIITVSKNGEMQKNKIIDVDNLYELNSMLPKNSNEFAIFGNSSLNKTFEPFQINVSLSGEKLANLELPQVYSTLISDVIKYDDSFMILHSKIGKNNLYNISLNKVNAQSGNVEWLKVISSENNEEADKIVATKGGDFFVLGKKYNDNVTEFVPIVYKIDANGKQLWKKAIDVPSSFNKQSIAKLNDDNLIYVCGYTKNPTGFCETRVIKLSNSGEEIASTSIKDFSANGIIQASDETYLIFGSKFIVDQQQIVTKGKFVLIDKELTEKIEKTLDNTDKPDVLLKSKNKTSSDFICAQLLADKKIALGGKVFMPVSNDLNARYNVPLLMIVNNDGSYKK